MTVVLEYQFRNKKDILLSARATSVICKINTTKESSTKLILFKKHILYAQEIQGQTYKLIYIKETEFLLRCFVHKTSRYRCAYTWYL